MFLIDEQAVETRLNAWSAIKLLKNVCSRSPLNQANIDFLQVDGNRKEVAEGVLLLISANLLYTFRPEAEQPGDSLEALKVLLAISIL